MEPSKGIRCPHCKSKDVHGRGKGRYQCQECEKYFRPKTKTEETITEEKNRREISTVLPVRIVNEAQLVSQCEIDTDVWEFERWTCDKKEAIARGDMKTLFHVKVWLRKRVREVEARDAIASLIEDAKRFAPKYKKLTYPVKKGEFMYEIDLADLHFGKLTWNEETSQDYDISIAAEAAKHATVELLGFIEHLQIEKILLPLGNDFFNVNGAGEFTVNGTRQVEDTRWQKTFREGRKLLVEMIDICAQIAPVDILIVPGNHDRERMFYAGDALECWYHNHPNVTVDNRAVLRKYYLFGNSLIGFTHGSEEKFASLPGIMALEQPDLWAKSTHREWHLGDRHHKEVLVQRVKELSGVTVRLMRSLTPPG